MARHAVRIEVGYTAISWHRIHVRSSYIVIVFEFHPVWPQLTDSQRPTATKTFQPPVKGDDDEDKKSDCRASLHKADVKYTELLKEINTTYHTRPHNSANNSEFEKYFQTVLTGLNLSVYEIGAKIDIYTDFTVYNQVRLELEREMFKKVQVAEKLLKLGNLLPKCHSFFTNQQVQLKASLGQSNLMKLEMLNDPSHECENVELDKIFIQSTPNTTAKPISYLVALQDMLKKYSKRPWRNRKYVEFDEQIWKVFMATNSEDKNQQKMALETFKAYDTERAKLDKDLSNRIGKFKKQIANESKSDCKSDLRNINKRLSQAMFQTIEQKRAALEAAKYSKSCDNNQLLLKVAITELSIIFIIGESCQLACLRFK
ncbi:uncharacterized protein LOC108109405 [Drosophila eugracilis]|uniref:uncharacterized protein LOC108109405 n=1 Tax=Drosophila eugracilis TaxID=29029 RepID=UPI001BDAB4CB|nr:uncharacterized protein LOC108109405 [Drosophila eugracilis]